MRVPCGKFNRYLPFFTNKGNAYMYFIGPFLVFIGKEYHAKKKMSL